MVQKRFNCRWQAEVPYSLDVCACVSEKFDGVSQALINSASISMESTIAIFATMSSSMTGLASAAEWPFYTQQGFEVFGQSFLEGSGAEMVSWSPIVSGETQRRLWGNYSSSNDGWVEEGLAWQSLNMGTPMPPGPFNIPTDVYRKQPATGTPSPEVGSGPFAPVWQMSGAPSDPSVVNYNLLSDDIFKATFDATVQSGTQSLSSVISDASWYYGDSAKPVDGIPQGLLMTPLFNSSSLKSNIVGVVVSVLSWGTFFQNVLEPRTPNVVVVVNAESCGGIFTLQVQGSAVSYLGEGDMHDTSYSDLGVSVDIAEDLTVYAGCTYSISIYPSQEFVGTYETNAPVYWTVFVVGILVFTFVSFFVFDLFVQKRQFKYLTSAAKSNAIVSSLFPEEVRDRLFGKDTSAEKLVEQKLPESSKFRLRSYLSNENGNVHDVDEQSTGNLSASDGVPEQKEMAVPNADVGVDMYQTKPIADLFPNTTIMFADIAGFTAWSSVREPSQVFTLLENVYSAFDSVARRRKVFKVETVG